MRQLLPALLPQKGVSVQLVCNPGVVVTLLSLTLNPIPFFPPPKGARPEAEQGPPHLHVRTGFAKSARKSKEFTGTVSFSLRFGGGCSSVARRIKQIVPIPFRKLVNFGCSRQLPITPSSSHQSQSSSYLIYHNYCSSKAARFQSDCIRCYQSAHKHSATNTRLINRLLSCADYLKLSP